MRIFESRYYPKFMYIALILVSLLIFFSYVDILNSANERLHEKSLTGYVVNNISNNISKNISTNSSQEKQELYSQNSYMIYYLLIIGIVAAIFITFMSLKSTVNKNIEYEEKRHRL